MKKFVLFSDLHLGKQNHNQFWSDLALKFFDEMIDFCIKEDVKDVICLGDFFDSRKNLNVLTINLAELICKKYFEKNEINLYIIRGNHDTFYKNLPEPNSLSFLNLFNYVHVIEKEIFLLNDFYLVPWGNDLSSIPDNSYIMGHFEINGFITNDSGYIQKDSKLNVSDFKRFRKVLSGHFHTPSIQNNIQYIGSAFAMDFNDANSERGFYLLENETLNFIEFTLSPKFIKLSSEDDPKKFPIENNFIKLIFVKDYGNLKNQSIIQNISDLNPHSLVFDYKIVEDDDIVIEEENFTMNNNSDILKEYIDKVEIGEHLNKKMLKSMIKKIEEE